MCLFGLANVATVAIFTLLRDASSKLHLSDRGLLLCSMLTGAVCNAKLLPLHGSPSPTLFVTAFVTQAVTFTIGRSSANALYDRLLSERIRTSAHSMLLVVGTAARIIAPYVAVYALVSHRAMAFIFGSAVAILASCAVALMVFYPYLEV